MIHSGVGVRDKVGPQCVTEHSTHLIGNALEKRAPTLLCALTCHPGQFDRVGGLVRTQAMSRHLRAAVVPWLREPAVSVTSRSRIRASRRLGGRPRCRRCFVLSCGEHERPLCLEVAAMIVGKGSHSAHRNFAKLRRNRRPPERAARVRKIGQHPIENA